jgi:hypothetical protein
VIVVCWLQSNAAPFGQKLYANEHGELPDAMRSSVRRVASEIHTRAFDGLFVHIGMVYQVTSNCSQ